MSSIIIFFVPGRKLLDTVTITHQEDEDNCTLPAITQFPGPLLSKVWPDFVYKFYQKKKSSRICQKLVTLLGRPLRPSHPPHCRRRLHVHGVGAEWPDLVILSPDLVGFVQKMEKKTD